MYDIELRYTQRNATCRGCDKDIERNTEKVIYTYSIRNRGQNIFFCLDCVKRMNELIEEDKKNG